MCVDSYVLQKFLLFQNTIPMLQIGRGFFLNVFMLCNSSSMLSQNFLSLFLWKCRHRQWINTPIAVILSFRHCKRGLWLSRGAKSSSRLSIASHFVLCGYYLPACWRRKCVLLSFVQQLSFSPDSHTGVTASEVMWVSVMDT